MAKETYKDDKGRTRWYRNDDIAAIVKQLGDYLIIGGYPEEHAKRYSQLAHTISRWPDSVEKLADNDKLNSIPGVGGVITGYLDEIIRTGTTEKFNDEQYGKPPPRTVLQLTEIERLGAKTARLLYQDHGIDSMAMLCRCARNGELKGIAGMGPKMLERINAVCAKNKA